MRSFIGALVAAMVLCGAARADGADAVKRIEKLGGTGHRDDKQPSKPVDAVILDGTKVTDADLKEMKELKQLKRL